MGWQLGWEQGRDHYDPGWQQGGRPQLSQYFLVESTEIRWFGQGREV